MKRVVRVFFRAIFHTGKFFLRVVESFNARFYMLLYQRLLAAHGIKFTGTPRYISTIVRFDDFNQITLGERVVVSEKVIFLTHDYSLTTALIALNKTPRTDMAFLKPIVVKENVFIGMGSIIMPGTVINKNVIIGAGTVVRGTIPENSIVIGNPGKVVCNILEKGRKWEATIDNLTIRVD